MTRPYADAVEFYRKAGWAGVIPIGRGLAQKSPPPTGFTGYAGVDPSGADIYAWSDGPEAEYSIGLHLPPGVYVLDVDAHSGKPAMQSVMDLEQRAGSSLPATWTNTARGQESGSRQHFFRAELPAGRVWHDHPGSGLDSLHVGHRYAVVAPSWHAKVDAQYEWYDPEGELYEAPPTIEELAWLPAEWVDVLSKPGEPMAGTAADDATTLDTIKAFRQGEMCRVTSTIFGEEYGRIAAATDGGSLHDSGKLHSLVALGIEGHRGVGFALGLHQDAYVEARVRLRGEDPGSAGADWWRMVRGSVGKKLAAFGGHTAPVCTCDDQFAGIIAPADRTVSQPTLTRDELASDRELPGSGKQASSDPSALDKLRAQLVTTDQLDDIPEARPLVPGALYLDKLAWLYGMPKSLKSFLALDLAGCVAAGLPWQGFPAGEPHEVVYLVAEGVSGIRKRVRAWEEHYGRKMTGVHFLPVAVQAVSDGTWQPFVQLSAEIMPGLVIVDTQARVTTGVEENSAKEIGVFIHRLDQLREATGACVLTVHHTGRNGEHLRGSIAMDGAADTAMLVTRTEGTVTVKCVFQKDGEEFEPFLSRLHPVGESIIVARDASRGGSASIPSWVYEMWKQHGPDLVAPSLLYRTEIVTETTFHRDKKQLLTAGILIKEESGRYPTYRLTGPPPGSEAASQTPPVRHGESWESASPEASDSHGSVREAPKVCRICGEALDSFLIERGIDIHTSC